MIADKPIMALVLCLLLAGSAMLSCSPRALREGRDVVAQADSLRAEGEMYSDSIPLAQAYETLGQWQWFYEDEYAHACYHYGRLLREKDHPAEAMQCFINATHSRTRDYHILGRVYSNMGSICHLARDFSRSYDMYGCSAKAFLQEKDSVAYFYALNDMAFECAEQGKKDESLTILSIIKEICNNEGVLTKIHETTAEAYLYAQIYDSTIFYARKSLTAPDYSLLPYVQIAQAYSLLAIKDSATFYAKIIINNTDDIFVLNNALYILTNDDESKNISSVRETAAERSDVQEIIEIRQGKLSQAVQLLEQDINRRYDWTWLIAIVITIIIIALGIVLYCRHQSNKHNLLSQKVEDLTNAYTDIQTSKLINIERVCETLRTSPEFAKDICWRDYNKMCDFADNHFYLLTTKLKQQQILNEQEIRLCILVLINYNNKGIAQILSYALSGVGKFKYRIAHKLGIESKNLRKFLLSLAIDEPFAP